jgi:uncharacterized repeat protein (TIGR04138 family)
MSSHEEFLDDALAFDEELRVVAKIDGLYDVEAYKFTFEGLHYTLSKLPEPRHVSAYELLEGIREFAKDKFGFMARTVFKSWGLRSTNDFGEIVFSLVSHGLMGKTDEDRREDFDNVYDFKKVFDEEYLAELPQHVRLTK